MKIFMLLTLLGICLSGPGARVKKHDKTKQPTATTYQITPGLLVHFN